MNLDWADLAFGSKKAVKDLRATFIAAPRELSTQRFTQLVKELLPHGPIVLGIAKESFVLGFEGQPQFRMLQAGAVQAVIDKVNASASKNKIYTLAYFQRELPFVLEKLPFQNVLFVNGSWYGSFHTRPEFYELTSCRVPYQLVSPFCDEHEAREYEAQKAVEQPQPNGAFSETEMLELASQAAQQSYDYGFQTGVALGRKKGKRYEFLASSFNKVVPYQTYAMHHGASRERHFSPTNDLNHYDTIHAEVGLLVAAQKQCIDLAGTTLFINLLPCPSCARMFTQTDIAEFVYRIDHSDGYAVKLLQLAGKKVTRIV